MSLHAPKEVLAFHGCSEEAANSILSSNSFRHSTNAYDWLGDGFYFWEYAPHRAMEWAKSICERAADGSKPVIIRATIQLGNCLNLLDTEHMIRLTEAYQTVVSLYAQQGRPLPKNAVGGAHFLDQKVINLYCRKVEEITDIPIQTVRGCFPEGDPIYPQSRILSKAHVQIAVRDSTCVGDATIIYL